jgi:thiol-disulfide isomerase/thioredoxin
MFCCETKHPQGARIAFDFPKDDSVNIKVFHYPILTEKVLAQLGTDSTGHGLIQLELSKPLMLDMAMNNNLYKLYLKPGYDLKISKDTTQSPGSILFEGEGAVMNNYLNHVSTLLDANYLIDYDFKAFTKKYDSLNAIVENYSNSYFSNFSIPKDELELLKQTTKMRFLFIKAEYGHRAHEAAYTEQAFKYLNGEPAEKIKISDEQQSLFSDIPFDTTYLMDGMFEYKSVLYQYLREKHLLSFEFEFLKTPDQWPRRSNTLIKNGSYPRGISEYLIARDLMFWMEKITPEIDSLFDEFKRDFEGSIYTADLQTKYDELTGLLPGNIAPNFSGRDLEGKLISLKDFKGKVVYVDVWATWCGPCVEEIPHAKKLQTAFKSKNVIFLNVSVDKIQEAWRQKLTKEKDWLGIHIILDKREIDSLSENYKLYGIPKYFLIDQSGRIVSVHASRPSSTEAIKAEIAALLK